MSIVTAFRLVTSATGPHPFPSRTRSLSLSAPMVLRLRDRGRVGRCQPPLRSPLGSSQAGFVAWSHQPSALPELLPPAGWRLLPSPPCPPDAVPPRRDRPRSPPSPPAAQPRASHRPRTVPPRP